MNFLITTQKIGPVRNGIGGLIVDSVEECGDGVTLYGFHDSDFYVGFINSTRFQYRFDHFVDHFARESKIKCKIVVKTKTEMT